MQIGKKKKEMNPKSMEFHHIWSVYSSKGSERNIWQELSTTENTDSDLKAHALHYANEPLVRVRLSFQKLLQTRLRWCYTGRFLTTIFNGDF